MIPLPSSLKVISKKSNNLATFEIEGLYPGYGVTIGNSLRRVLLSSIEGAAITQVKIAGVQHEFSTLPGVLEDVLHIILNLKKVRCKMYTSEPQKMELSVKGEGEVKAKDIKTPTQVEIVNPEAHIATLTSKNASLQMELLVERGLGYVPVEQRKKEKTPIGTIMLDAIFTPIQRVAFKVENMRVGERTDYDRLFLEIETDGSITPEEALAQSASILVDQFALIRDTFLPQKEDKVTEEQKKDKTNKKKK